MKFLFCMVLTVLISSCATSFDPSSFQKYQGDEYFELKTDFKYSERRGLGFLWEQGLVAGIYKGVLHDKNGTFFMGPNIAICQANPKCDGFTSSGGIWVSKRKPSDIRLFGITKMTDADRDRNAQYGYLISALANASDGEYYLFPNNKEFASKISSSLISPTNL